MRLIPILTALLLPASAAQAAENLDAALQELATDVLSFFGDTPPEKIAISTIVHGDGQCSALSERASNRFQGTLFRVKPDQTSVIDRRSLSAIFREQDLIEDGTVSPDGAATIARIAQVDAIITGTISRYGQQVELESSMLDAVNGTVLGFAYSSFPMTETDLELLANKSLATCSFASSGRSTSPQNDTTTQLSPTDASGSNAVFTSEHFEVSIVSLNHSQSSGEITATLRFRNTSDKKIGLSYRANTLSISDNTGRLFQQGEQWSGIRVCGGSLSYCNGTYADYTTSVASGTQAQVTFNATGDPDIEVSRLSMTLEMVLVPDLDNEKATNIVSVGFFDVPPTVR